MNKDCWSAYSKLLSSDRWGLGMRPTSDQMRVDLTHLLDHSSLYAGRAVKCTPEHTGLPQQRHCLRRKLTYKKDKPRAETDSALVIRLHPGPGRVRTDLETCRYEVP